MKARKAKERNRFDIYANVLGEVALAVAEAEAQAAAAAEGAGRGTGDIRQHTITVKGAPQTMGKWAGERVSGAVLLFFPFPPLFFPLSRISIHPFHLTIAVCVCVCVCEVECVSPAGAIH